MRAECEVIVLFASELRQVEDDDELHPALVRPAEVQELLEFGAIGGLGTAAFFADSCENFEALTLAVFLAGLQLRGQTQILGLLFRADADVDDRADHLRELRPLRRGSQARRTHRLLNRRTILQECFNQHVRHRLGVPPNSINFFIRQACGVVAQQLATTSNRDLIGNVR
jgi:hypothetical protein